MRARGLAALVAFVGVSVLAAAPAAADVRVRGTVVRIDDGEIYFDVGDASGLEPGRPARAWRRIHLKHPVTQKPISDEIPLGALHVTAVGRTLSVAVVEGELEYPIQVGDQIEVLVEREEPAPPPPRTPAPPVTSPPSTNPLPPAASDGPLPAVDPATQAVVDAWQSTIGKPLDVRIASWEVYLAQHPDSPYAAQVRAELENLKALREKFAVTGAGGAAGEPRVDGVEHQAAKTWEWHQPLGLAFLARKGGITGAWLHYRRLGTDTYRRVELAHDGDGYLRATIAASEVQAPGVEYFVEVLTQAHEIGAAVGSPTEPVRVDVAAPGEATLFKDPRNRSRISVSTAYLDFGGFDHRSGTTDHMAVFEADFLYRLRTLLYGIRVGMGVLSGEGGYRDPQLGPATRAAFNYGYTEVELRGKGSLALLTRLIAGEGKDGLGFGAEARLRLGDEEGTNLTFGASTVEKVGFVSELKFQWMAFPRFPLGLGIAVGDQPNRGDLGVRFSADLGVRVLSWLTPTVQVSYQGRSLEHSGMGAGLGLVFDW
jgi:hypothetical protein